MAQRIASKTPTPARPSGAPSGAKKTPGKPGAQPPQRTAQAQAKAKSRPATPQDRFEPARDERLRRLPADPRMRHVRDAPQLADIQRHQLRRPGGQRELRPGPLAHLSHQEAAELDKRTQGWLPDVLAGKADVPWNDATAVADLDKIAGLPEEGSRAAGVRRHGGRPLTGAERQEQRETTLQSLQEASLELVDDGARPGAGRIAWTDQAVAQTNDYGEARGVLPERRRQASEAAADQSMKDGFVDPATYAARLRDAGMTERTSDAQIVGAASWANQAPDAATRALRAEDAANALHTLDAVGRPPMSEMDKRNHLAEVSPALAHELRGPRVRHYDKAVEAVGVPGSHKLQLTKRSTLTVTNDPTGQTVAAKLKRKSGGFLKKVAGIALKAASVIPSPIQPAAAVASAAIGSYRAARSGNLLGAVASAAGGLAGAGRALGGLAVGTARAAGGVTASLAGAGLQRAAQTVAGVASAANAIKNKDALGALTSVAGAASAAGYAGARGLSRVASRAQMTADGFLAARRGDVAGLLSSGTGLARSAGALPAAPQTAADELPAETRSDATHPMSAAVPAARAADALAVPAVGVESLPPTTSASVPAPRAADDPGVRTADVVPPASAAAPPPSAVDAALAPPIDDAGAVPATQSLVAAPLGVEARPALAPEPRPATATEPQGGSPHASGSGFRRGAAPITNPDALRLVSGDGAVATANPPPAAGRLRRGLGAARPASPHASASSADGGGTATPSPADLVSASAQLPAGTTVSASLKARQGAAGAGSGSVSLSASEAADGTRALDVEVRHSRGASAETRGKRGVGVGVGESAVEGYRLTGLSPELSERIERGEAPVPDPTDPDSLPTGLSVSMRKGNVQTATSGGRWGTAAFEGSVSTGTTDTATIAKLDDGTVRLTVEPSDQAGNGLEVTVGAGKVKGGLGGSKSLTAGVARSVTVDPRTPEGRALYDEFVSKQTLPAGGDAGVLDSRTTETLSSSESTSLFGEAFGFSAAKEIASAQARVVRTTLQDGSQVIERTGRIEDVETTQRVVLDADGNVDPTRTTLSARLNDASEFTTQTLRRAFGAAGPTTGDLQVSLSQADADHLQSRVRRFSDAVSSGEVIGGHLGGFLQRVRDADGSGAVSRAFVGTLGGADAIANDLARLRSFERQFLGVDEPLPGQVVAR